MSQIADQKTYRTIQEFFQGDELCMAVYDKYRLKDRSGNFIEQSPEQTIERVVNALASVDPDPVMAKKVFMKAVNNFRGVVPQGSVLFGAGNEHYLVSLSNCFVIKSPTDSVDGIFKTASEEAQIMKRRGGVGIDLSTLRPAKAITNNSSLTSSGAAGWANFFSDTCRSIGQDGRRGALMLTIDIKHPDALLWAQMKKDLTRVTGANVSIKITNEFMQAVREDKEFVQQWPVDSKIPSVKKVIQAKELWKQIIQCAWEMAEPGLLMWDNIIENLPANCYENFKSTSTNPCAELVLSNYDSCRLISMNLSHYVNHPFSKQSEFDMTRFKEDTFVGMWMSDNLVELELQHVKKIIEIADSQVERELWQKIYQAGERGRRTGLGTHGLADCLAKLGFRYDGTRAQEVMKEIYETFRNEAYRASIHLAKTRGTFPDFNWEQEKDCAFIKRLPKDIQSDLQEFGRRNISLLTMAPTGSISILSKVSSGLEPVFRNSYTRRKKINQNDTNTRVDFTDQNGDKWQEYEVFHWNVKEYMELKGTKELPEYFVTSDQIDWKRRVEIQGVIQQYIDHSISSTINLPKTVTPETVAELYMMGWKHGLKGITVYRDGCRSGVLLSEESKRPDRITTHEAPKRGESLPCDIHHVTVKGKPWVVMVGKLNGQPYEVFAGQARKVQVPKKYTEGKITKHKRSYFLEFNDEMKLDIIECFDNDEEQAVTRLLSMSMRHGVPLAYIVDQLEKVEDKDITVFNKAIMRVLKKYMKNEDAAMLKCKECGQGSLVMENGCYVCKNCGSSKCS